MLELIIITKGGEICKGRHIKHIKAEKYTREGSTRTITRYETQGRMVAYKQQTLLSLAEDSKDNGKEYYREGRRIDTPYKEAAKAIRDIIKLTEDAKEKWGAGHAIATYYF